MRKRETTSNKRRRKKIVEVKNVETKTVDEIVQRTNVTLVVDDARSLAPVIRGVRSRNRRRARPLPSAKAVATAIAIRRISSSAPSPQRSSSIVRHARAFPETTIFTSSRSVARCAPLARYLAPVHLVGDPS